MTLAVGHREVVLLQQSLVSELQQVIFLKFLDLITSSVNCSFGVLKGVVYVKKERFP